MGQFNYTLPSGSEFTLRVPVGTTQAQADRIFYEQVAAGALVGYQPGQTLTSAATQVTKFELSRLDRGTAGVDNNPILAISQGSPVISGNVGRPGISPSGPSTQDTLFGGAAVQDIFSSGVGTSGIFSNGAATQTILSAVQALPVPVSIPNLSEVVLTNPIDEADVVSIRADDLPPGAIEANGITALSEFQVQKLLAQISNIVDQDSDQITLEKGIGRYGFTSYALEQAGYVKPGTSLKFFDSDPAQFVSVMSSPSVWTGKGGIYSLSDLLIDPALQNRVQTQLMQQGYDELLFNGTITTVAKPSISRNTGQVFTNSGFQSVAALTALGILSANTTAPTGIAQNASTGATAINRLLNTATVNLATIGSGAVNSLTAGSSNLGNLSNLNISNLTNRITGGVGSLVANASKFGSEATALWAKAGSANLAGSQLANLGNLGIGSLQRQLGSLSGALTGQFGSLTGNINNITKNLTNLVPGSLENLTGSLNILGKAGTFATNFANPLASLNNLPNLGSLQGALTGQLGSLQGALTGQLGALTGQLSGTLSGALGSLGNFANLGALSGVFGGGGDLVSGTTVAAGFNNTVNRSTVDAAFARILGNDKIPLPTFQYPSLAALSARLDIQQAQNFLRNLPSSASPTFGQTVTV